MLASRAQPPSPAPITAHVVMRLSSPKEMG
jgi:hypothetical protein